MAVAVGVSNAVYFGLLQGLEESARTLVVEPQVEEYIYCSKLTEMMSVLIACVLFAFFRIEMPWTMTACGFAFALAYMLAIFEVALIFGLVLPIVSPLLGILLSSVFLGTMAWSEERGVRRRLEELERARQEFTDMLVHDLRRRMSSILMSFSLFEKKAGQQDDETRELMTTMRVIADRVLIQINDLLAIRRIEEGKLVLERERVNIGSLLEDALREHQPVSKMVGVDIHLVSQADCGVFVDAEVFSRVMANLLWNALEHAPEGTGVEVGYSCSEDGGLALYVANRGKCVPAEKREELFRAFVSSRKESLIGRVPVVGLGLAFCKLALEAHGGTVALESPWLKTGDGVMVTVSLPGQSALQG